VTPTQWNALVSSLERATAAEIMAAFTAQSGQAKVAEVARGLARREVTR
jgi:hypothetical protein